MLSCEFCQISKNTFLKNTSGGCFCISYIFIRQTLIWQVIWVSIRKFFKQILQIWKSDKRCLNDKEKLKDLMVTFKLTLFFLLRSFIFTAVSNQINTTATGTAPIEISFLQWFLRISISFSKNSRCNAKELLLKYSLNLERHCKIHLLAYKVTYRQIYFPVDTPHK